jgi:hypothetical protein
MLVTVSLCDAPQIASNFLKNNSDFLLDHDDQIFSKVVNFSYFVEMLLSHMIVPLGNRLLDD